MLEWKVMEQLRTWLNEQCEQQNLSWREASIKAGLNPGAISAIMNGQRPGLEVCKGLASYFRVSTTYVLSLAGHVPSTTTTITSSSPFMTVPMLRDFAERVSGLPPERQRKIMEAALLLLEIDQGGTTGVTEEKVLL